MRLLPPGVLAVGVLPLAVGASMSAIVRVSDGLPREIASALTPAAHAVSTGGLEFVIIDGPPTGAARAYQVGLLVLLLGCVPVALVARLLVWAGTSQKAWSPAWDQVFLAGFVFQLSSVVLTGAILVLLASYVWQTGDRSAAAALVVLLLSVGCGTWGLSGWRALRHSVGRPPGMNDYGLRPSAEPADTAAVPRNRTLPKP